MDIQTALNKLFSSRQFGVKLGLENITRLLNHTGNPEKKLRAFHIAGSNGKGSTASFLASILTESGYNTGLFTSPHFVKFNERIRINGEMIPDEYVLAFMKDLGNYIDKYEPTFFELTTAMAFKYFAETKVDFAVIEVGLGGRLDATNTIVPLASIITTIGYEHTHILGDGLAEIAREKAGIIKNNIPVFAGLMPDEAEREIEKIAKERNCNIFPLKNYIVQNDNDIRINLIDTTYTLYETPLRGMHQLINAALAIFAANGTLKNLTPKNFRDGIDNVIKNSGIQGRYEIHNSNPKIIFDSAHNPEGILTFIKEFEKDKKACSKAVLLFGAMKDKNNKESIKLLKNHFDKIYFTSIDYHRAANPAELVEIAKSLNVQAEIVTDKSEFINKFKERKDNACLAVAGSIYLLGEIKNALKDKNVLTF